MSLSDATCWRHLREPNVVMAYKAKFSQNESWNRRSRVSGCCFILLLMSQLDLNSAALSVSYAHILKTEDLRKGPVPSWSAALTPDTTLAVGW